MYTVLLHLLLLPVVATAAATAAAGSGDLQAETKTYYPVEAKGPNSCQEVFRSEQDHNVTFVKGKYIPFVGTSLVRDSQLLALRLLYSLDYPVKHFILVVPRRAMAGGRVMRHEVQHFKDYGTNIIIIACQHPPSVAEGWNAVFHALSAEPWGIYNARDTAWEPGSLARVAEQFWPMVESKEADVGLVGYSNLDPESALMAAFNVFILTRELINRFGYFDESFYPAFCEDDDFVMRLSLMKPPGVIKILKDVFVVHGPRRTKTYISGTTLEVEEGDMEGKRLRTLMDRKKGACCNLFLRKWGCMSERAREWVRTLHDTCKHKTPFGKDVPLWWWNTTKEERERDKQIEVRHVEKPDDQNAFEVWDMRTNTKVFDVPDHYGEWKGYYEPGASCRLSGQLGRIPPPSLPTTPSSANEPNCL